MADRLARTLNVLVTGAAGGIGRALVEELSRRGHRVLATGHDESRLTGFPAGVLTQRLDVRSSGAWDEAVGRALHTWGRIDVVVNNAGVLKPGYLHELPASVIDLHLDVNVKGVMLGTRAAAIAMVPQGGGHVINVASLAGIAPVPGLSLYSASKFAVRGFSLAMAQELAPHGVAVTLVSPDAVETKMLALQEDYDEAAWTFSGRPLTVDDVVRAIVDDALVRRPLEITLPQSRGLLARLGALTPGMSAWLVGGRLTNRGLAAQRERRRKKKDGG